MFAHPCLAAWSGEMQETEVSMRLPSNWQYTMPFFPEWNTNLFQRCKQEMTVYHPTLKGWCRKLNEQLLICRRNSDKLNVRPIMFFSRRRHADHLCWRRRYFTAKGSCHADKDLRYSLTACFCIVKVIGTATKSRIPHINICWRCKNNVDAVPSRKSADSGQTSSLNRGWKKTAYMKVWPSKSLQRVHQFEIH